jgi:hypothetical protein
MGASASREYGTPAQPDPRNEMEGVAPKKRKKRARDLFFFIKEVGDKVIPDHNLFIIAPLLLPRTYRAVQDSSRYNVRFLQVKGPLFATAIGGIKSVGGLAQGL